MERSASLIARSIADINFEPIPVQVGTMELDATGAIRGVSSAFD